MTAVSVGSRLAISKCGTSGRDLRPGLRRRIAARRAGRRWPGELGRQFTHPLVMLLAAVAARRIVLR
jgi:hypothetical protein